MCQPPWEAVEDWSDMHAGLTLALSPEERVEPESSKLLIMALSFWWLAPILQLCRSQGSPQCCKVFYHADDFIECGRSESRLGSKTSIRIKCVTRHLLIRDLWEWGSLCQGPGPETKCVLLSVTHCLRHWLPWKKPGRKAENLLEELLQMLLWGGLNRVLFIPSVIKMQSLNDILIDIRKPTIFFLLYHCT